MPTTYYAAVQRALLEANDVMASMADRALQDCPTGRRLLMAALEAPSNGKATAWMAATVGLRRGPLTNRLYVANAPSLKEVATHVFRVRAAYLVLAAIPQAQFVYALGLRSQQNFGVAVRRAVGMTPTEWASRTSRAHERGVFWDFLRAGERGWRRVALVPARKRWLREVCCGA